MKKKADPTGMWLTFKCICKSEISLANSRVDDISTYKNSIFSFL